MNNTKEKSHRKIILVISLVLLVGLLILRLPFLLLLAYKVLPLQTQLGLNIFQDGTYILSALLIFLQRDTLEKHHIGFFALVIFLLAPILKLLVYLSIPHSAPYSWIEIAASVSLFVALLITRPKLRRRKTTQVLLWLLVAVVAGAGLGVLFGYLISFQSPRGPMHPTLTYFVSAFLAQLGNAAVLEEPLFRGFLWGFLKMARWKDVWIWLFQAGLFMLGHSYYLGSANISFFLVVPIGGLVLGLAAWRSRSIGTSMIMHGLANSLGDMVAHLTW